MQGEQIATAGNEELSVSVAADGAKWRIEVGESVLVVDAIEFKPGTWSLLLDGRSIVIDVDRSKDPSIFHTHSATTPIVLESAQRKRLAAQMGKGKSGKRREQIIKAPIAGRVVKIQVEVGQEVEAGYCVAILEAMKMENEIECAHEGIVTGVHANDGDSVETGAKLVTISPKPAPPDEE